MSCCPECGGKSGYYATRHVSKKTIYDGRWGKPVAGNRGVFSLYTRPGRRAKMVVCLDCLKSSPDPYLDAARIYEEAWCKEWLDVDNTFTTAERVLSVRIDCSPGRLAAAA